MCIRDSFTLIIKASVGIVVYLIACWTINAADCRRVIKDIREKLTTFVNQYP